MNFVELELSPTIIKSITEMGFENPTQVQSEVIPLIMEENDLIVMAKTGSGKTGAFGLPMLHMLEKAKLDGSKIEDVSSTDESVPEETEEVRVTHVHKQAGKKGPEALILTPTRELAVQVDSDIQKMSKYMDLKTTAVYGQHNMDQEIKELQSGVSIVTGTPGRVNDHLQRKTLITKNIKFLVLDEADRMLDMGFYDQVMDIIKTLPKSRVTLLFSATMPAEIKKICREYMKHPVTVELDSDTKTVDTIRQIYHRVDKDKKRTQLERVLRVEQPDSCMVFCNTRHEVDKVTEYLQKQGFYAKALHGAKDQNSRMKTINSFRDGKIQILVATDVAARGIHIDDLTLVINYDVPDKQDSYVHRIGRTGRAGNGGLAISLVTTDDIMSLYDLEVHVGCLIEEVDLPSDEVLEEAKNNPTGQWANKFYVMLPSDHLQKRQQDRDNLRGNQRSDRGRSQTGIRSGVQTSRNNKDNRDQREDRENRNSRDNHGQNRSGQQAQKTSKPYSEASKVRKDVVTKEVQLGVAHNENHQKVHNTVQKVQHNEPATMTSKHVAAHKPDSNRTEHVKPTNRPVKTDKYSTKYMVIDRTEEEKQKKKQEGNGILQKIQGLFKSLRKK